MKYQKRGKYLKKRSEKKCRDKGAHEAFVFVACKSQKVQQYHQKQGVGKNMRQDDFEYSHVGFGGYKICFTTQIISRNCVWCETYFV